MFNRWVIVLVGVKPVDGGFQVFSGHSTRTYENQQHAESDIPLMKHHAEAQGLEIHEVLLLEVDYRSVNGVQIALTGGQ